MPCPAGAPSETRKQAVGREQHEPHRPGGTAGVGVRLTAQTGSRVAGKSGTRGQPGVRLGMAAGAEKGTFAMKRFAQPTIGVLGALLLATMAGTAQHQHNMPPSEMPSAVPEDALANAEKTLKVGKKGDVKFSAETLVGDLRLKPGRYQLQHRTDSSDHFVQFTELSQSGGADAQPGEVKCRLEVLDKKVSATTVHTRPEGDAVRVTKVLISGENVAHVF